jgi:hypothetical protein
MNAPKYVVIAAARGPGGPSSVPPNARARAWKSSTASLFGAQTCMAAWVGRTDELSPEVQPKFGVTFAEPDCRVANNKLGQSKRLQHRLVEGGSFCEVPHWN